VENIKILSKNIRNNSHQNIILLKLKLTVKQNNQLYKLYKAELLYSKFDEVEMSFIIGS
jgi:hypothetical protein